MTSSNENALIKIDEVLAEHAITNLEQMPTMARSIAMARGLGQLRGLIKGAILDDICHLAGTPLGFKTDKDGKGEKYSKEVIRDCAIEGMLRGAQLVGNQINIIAGRCYLTKEFFEHQLARLVQNLRVTEGVPQTYPSGALVPMHATWIYQGKPDRIDCVKGEGEQDTRICVKVNAGMGADAILGKAYRKLYKRIYVRVTGSDWMIEEEPPEEITQAIATDSPTEEEPIDDFTAELTIYGDLSSVSAYESAMAERCRSAKELKILSQACERRREQIRGNRGERSNNHPVEA